MSESSSPIFIIVSALMAIVGISLVINITTGFVADTSQHSDAQEFNSLYNSIEQECNRLDELGSLSFAESVSVELRNAAIELEDNTLFYDRDGDTGDSLERDINCIPGLTNNINLDEYEQGKIPAGTYTVEIRESEDNIEVSLN